MFNYFKEVLTTLLEIKDLLELIDSRLENVEVVVLELQNDKRSYSGYQ